MRKFMLLLMLLCITCLPALAQQTQTLPQKVEVKPRSADRAVDSLRVWGGICAGGDPCTTIVDTTGTLSVAAALADGSIDFDKLKDENCADNEVIGWDEDTLHYVCMTVATMGGLTASGSYTITGDWGFNPSSSAGTFFGEDPGAEQREIHVYNSGGAAGIRIQSPVTSGWDLVTNSGSGNFVISDPDVGNALSISDTTNNVTISNNLTVNDDTDLNGILTLTTISDNVVPTTGNAYDLGNYIADRRWRDLYVSSIDTAIFREATIQVVNGQMWVTTYTGKLVDNISNSITTVDLGISETSLPTGVTVPFWIVLKGRTVSGAYATEYMRVAADNDGVLGGTEWTVCRDIGDDNDACGANTGYQWNEGTPWVMLGNNGNGRVEINSNSNKPQMALVRQGATWNASTVFGAFGSLTGISLGNMGSGNKIGLAVGTSTGYLKYQTADFGGVTDGDDDTLIVLGTIRATAGWFGSNGSDDGVLLTSTGLQLLGTAGKYTGAIRAAKTSAADTATDGFYLGTDGAGGWDFLIGGSSAYLQWDDSANTLTIRGTLNADDITSGSLPNARIATNAINSARISNGAVAAVDMANAYNQNVIANSAFAWGTDGWEAGYETVTAPGGTMTLGVNATGKRLGGDTNDTMGTLYWSWSGTPVAAETADVQYPLITGAGDYIPVLPSQNYELSGYVAKDASVTSITCYIFWYDSTPNYLSASQCTTASTSTGGSLITDYERIYVIASSPANAYYAGVAFRATYNGGATPDAYLTRAFFGQAPSGQTAVSPWVPAGVTTISGGLIKTGSIVAANIATNTLTADQIATDAITADEIATMTLSAISADLGTITAGTITGATFQTLASCGTTNDECIKLTSTGMTFYSTGAATPIALVTLSASGSYGTMTFADYTGTTFMTVSGAVRSVGRYGLDFVNGSGLNFGGENTAGAQSGLYASADGTLILQAQRTGALATLTLKAASPWSAVGYESSIEIAGSSGGDITIDANGDTLLKDLVITYGAMQPDTDNAQTIGLYNKRYVNINLNLPNNTDPGYVVVNKGGGGSDANTALGYVSGVTGTVSVRKGDDTGSCDLVFEAGILTSETC